MLRRRNAATSPAPARCCWWRTKTRCAPSPRGRCATRATTCWRPTPARPRWRYWSQEAPIDLLVTGHAKGAVTAGRQIQELKIDVPMIAITHCESAKRTQQFPEAAEGFLRSEEPRVGKGCVSTCRSRWAPYSYKKKQPTHIVNSQSRKEYAERLTN